MPLRINIGCGQTPTKGWSTFDNSLSLRICEIPKLPEVLLKLNILDTNQYQFIQFAKDNSIENGDATLGLPLENQSVDVIYSSHMLEHLDRTEVGMFLNESFRILIPNGIIRITVPDISRVRKKSKYLSLGDGSYDNMHSTNTLERGKWSARRRSTTIEDVQLYICRGSSADESPAATDTQYGGHSAGATVAGV